MAVSNRLLTALRDRRYGISGTDLCNKLEVSRATLARHVSSLRNAGYPIVFDRESGKYRLDEEATEFGRREEMPGIWIDPSEAYALLTLFNVMRRIDPGFLGTYIYPLRGLLKRLLIKHRYPAYGLDRKVAVDFGKVERVKAILFQHVSRGLLDERRLKLTFAVGHKEAIATVSPERVVLTPSGWRLDVLDHETDTVRTIDMISIKEAKVLEDAATLHPQFNVLGTGTGNTTGNPA